MIFAMKPLYLAFLALYVWFWLLLVILPRVIEAHDLEESFCNCEANTSNYDAGPCHYLSLHDTNVRMDSNGFCIIISVYIFPQFHIEMMPFISMVGSQCGTVVRMLIVGWSHV